MEPLLLTPREAARAIGFSASCLAKWRMSGIGPRFVKIAGLAGGGAVRYSRADLEAWINERTTGSTAEISTRRAAAGPR